MVDTINNKVYYRLSHDVVTRDVSTAYCDWCISVLPSSIVRASGCYHSGPLLYRSPVVVFFDRGHPRFGNFNSASPVDVIRMKSYVDSFLDPTCVPVWVSVNKLNLVPN